MPHFDRQELWISNKELFNKWIIKFTGLDPDIDINVLDDNCKEKIIYNFWNMFFNKNLSIYNKPVVSTNDEDLVNHDTGVIKVSKSIFVKQYKDKVYELMNQYKMKKKSGDTLLESIELQEEIENLTMKFSEENIFASCPNIMEMMTKPSLPNAKEYLLQKYKVDKVDGRIKIISSADEDSMSKVDKKVVLPLLTEDDKELISLFGQHTIECILVHTLCYLFNIDKSVSVASLIDRIESGIRQHAKIQRDNLDNNLNKKDIKINLKYPFGTALVEYLIARNMIVIKTVNLDTSNSVKKKGKSYYREKSNFAECAFNTSLLPVKFNLPMICKPLEWEYDVNVKYFITISDLYGGYLHKATGQIYESYRLFTSSNQNNFNIIFGAISDPNTYKKVKNLCNSISWLQNQSFKINSQFLEYILNKYEFMVINGLLMPEFLSNITMNDASKILRECYMNSEKIQSIYKFSELVEILSKNVQQSRYEQTIIDMAKAYDGYRFYFPAFLDFRGRIYRCGLLNFHERDFARSLILIADDNLYSNTNGDNLLNKYFISTAFHYKSYKDEKSALSDRLNIKDKMIKNGKKPFQFLANLRLLEHCIEDPKRLEQLYLSVPITQDASASAYQIMSYYILDENMAFRTNIHQSSSTSNIEDIYEYFLKELNTYLKESLSSNPSLLEVTRVLNRKIAKGIFMPMIYGKTMNSTITELNNHLSKYIIKKESIILASNIYKFWVEKYTKPQILMKLIPLLGRFMSAVDRPVCYSTPLYTTFQDYRVMIKNSVYVYDKNTKKRRSVTLTISSEKRDKRKTEISTFANFIHQKDAYIAMKMVEEMKEYNIPIYTVHDNFITNTMNCENLNILYNSIFRSLEPPLKSINEFIDMNIIKPNYKGVVNLECIIPLSNLRTYLNAWNRPISENKKRWDANIERIIHYYNEYCKTVCCPADGDVRRMRWDEHMKRWDRFADKIQGKYSIHY